MQAVIENAFRRFLFPGLLTAIVGLLWVLASYQSLAAERSRQAAYLAQPPEFASHESSPKPETPVWLVIAETASDPAIGPT
ncbi:MAG TPA: hypothetical protein PLD59_09940 [Tepidisphaeraceae bacterium]|nr:hypothetical protein [Tepidisphaeraceae bacterium]